MSVVAIKSQAPNPSALEIAQAALDRVKSGETVAIAVVEVLRGRAVRTSCSAGDCYHLLNSGAARLANRLAAQDD